MNALPRAVRPYHLPGDGDCDQLGEVCSDLIAYAPRLAAWLGNNRHAKPNLLEGGSDGAPIRAILQALPKECGFAAEDFEEQRARLAEHRRTPGARRSDAWRMPPELPISLGAVRALFDAALRHALLVFDRAIELAKDENAALSALDAGHVVFDDDGDLVAAPSAPHR